MTDQPTAGVALKPDEGGCVTKRFVIFTRPGWAPEKKGGWLKREHLIDFLREVVLHDAWTPGFRATVLELTWNNDIWAEEGCAYLWEHDAAIGPRRARKEWKEAREKHERIHKTGPKAKLGDEIATFRKLTALDAPASGEVEAARKIGRWIDAGMPDHSDDTPTREALKRDLRTVLAAALISPARREGED